MRFPGVRQSIYQPVSAGTGIHGMPVPQFCRNQKAVLLLLSLTVRYWSPSAGTFPYSIRRRIDGLTAYGQDGCCIVPSSHKAFCGCRYGCSGNKPPPDSSYCGSLPSSWHRHKEPNKTGYRKQC